MIDLFNRKKLKETTIHLTEVMQDRNYWQKAYTSQVKDTNNLLKQNKDLVKSNNNLTEENQKLIDWIEKIINEVGLKTNNSYEGQTITIPYYEEIKPYKAYENDWIPKQERKDIIIPSIRFTKFRYKED